MVNSMYVKINKTSSGRRKLDYYRSYRDEEGISRQKFVERIGFIDELEKEFEDPISHFRAEALRLTKQNQDQGGIPDSISLNRDATVEVGSVSRFNVGYSVLQKIYHDLALDKFFIDLQKQHNIEYSLNDILKVLVYSRILTPASKLSTFKNKDRYFEKFDFSIKDMYRSLDLFNQSKENLQKHLHHSIGATQGRDTSIAYYDCTNYYFEITYNDNDIVDENGKLLKSGLRKKGLSKEHRTEPIVQMGLLMDNNGIPMAYNLFPGNESEKTSLQPILKRAKRDFNLDKTIVVADRGLNTSDNIFFNKASYDGYVYAQSIKGADKEFKEYTLDQNGYVESKSGFKIKSRIHTKDIKIVKDGKRNQTITAIQKQVVFYSLDFAKKAEYDRERKISKAQDLINNPGKYNRSTSFGAAHYVKNITYDKTTGEITKNKLFLDIQKIEAEAKYDGYYSIVTSEVEKSDDEIIQIYRGLWKIEESFKITKSEFKARPVYLSTEQHIQAHFLICFISLVIIRILNKEIGNQHSIKSIIKSLNRCECSLLEENVFMFDHMDIILESVQKTYDLNLDKKYQTRQQINNLISLSKKECTPHKE
jgi:hypothetical protein